MRSFLVFRFVLAILMLALFCGTSFAGPLMRLVERRAEIRQQRIATGVSIPVLRSFALVGNHGVFSRMASYSRTTTFTKSKSGCTNCGCAPAMIPTKEVPKEMPKKK